MKKIIFFVNFLFLIVIAKAQVNGAPEINLGPDMVISLIVTRHALI
ncbi:MAG: hypothetical protein R2777_07100 [Chitinophagales bacterium]